MALIKTIEEIKGYLPVSLEMDINNILPFIKQAERDYIIPLISQAQYDNLSAAYNVTFPDLTSAQSALLMRAQEALTAYAYYLWIPSGQLQIDDSGIRIANTDTLKTAFQWQIEQLQNSVLKQAGSAVDEMLSFMEANVSDYSLWAASSSYTEFKDCFISSATRFTELYSPFGNSRLNFLAVRSQMKTVEEFIIKPELGEDFYNELKSQFKANTLTASNAKLIPMIQKSVANYTISRAVTDLTISIDQRGILMLSPSTELSSNIKQPAKDSMISKIEMRTETDGKNFMRQIKDFLKTNISDYATYSASAVYNSLTTDTTFENKDTNTFYAAL